LSDGGQPAAQAQPATLVLVTTERPVGAHQRLLRQVLGIGAMTTAQTQRHAVDQVLVMAHEGRECRVPVPCQQLGAIDAHAYKNTTPQPSVATCRRVS
jgi:hypothetical protein